MKRLRGMIMEYIVNLIIDNVVIGGNCGCCGAVIPNELFPRYWPWGICRECLERSADD
jgi:hypothetical protein